MKLFHLNDDIDRDYFSQEKIEILDWYDGPVSFFVEQKDRIYLLALIAGTTQNESSRIFVASHCKERMHQKLTNLIKLDEKKFLCELVLFFNFQKADLKLYSKNALGQVESIGLVRKNFKYNDFDIASIFSIGLQNEYHKFMKSGPN